MGALPRTKCACTVCFLASWPYVLEFTGLAEKPQYLESDLEKEVIEWFGPMVLAFGGHAFCGI